MSTERVPTQKDIAAKLNLSQSLVAGVLGNRPNVWASAETRARIHLAAKELGYRPNAIARSLRQRSTNIIGFYSGHGGLDTLDPFIAEVIHGLQKGCEAAGKDLLMHGNVIGRSAEDIYRELMNGKVDGLILLSQPSNPLVALLSDSTLPVVAITDAIPSLPSVVADDAGGSRMIARYLAEKGHKRVLYRKSSLKTASDLRRLDAFCDACDDVGITIAEIVETLWSYGLHPEEKVWLSGPLKARPTAMVCWNDGAAYRALESCLDFGLRVPEDIAIVGFDGYQWPERPAKPLTTVRASWRAVARKALDLLAARLAGAEIPMETVLPVELVLGDTA